MLDAGYWMLDAGYLMLGDVSDLLEKSTFAYREPLLAERNAFGKAVFKYATAP